MIKKPFTIKSVFLIILMALISIQLNAQENRLVQIKLQLESITIDSPGLNEKADINVSNVLLGDFLRTVANAHKINLNISSDLNSIIITNNFSNSTVSDVLLFVCKEFNLTIDFIGNILSIKKIDAPKIIFQRRIIPMSFNPEDNLFSIDLEQDTLYIAFKGITDKTNKNLVFAPGIEHAKLSAYIKEMPFDSALDKIAFSNNLRVTKTNDNFYLFEKKDAVPKALSGNIDKRKNRSQKGNRPNYNYKIKDSIKYQLDVDFENVEIATVIRDIGYDLNLNMFTSSPLKDAGLVTVKANNISFNLLLDKLFENTEFTYKKQESIFYFGKRSDATIRNTVTIPLLHRSIEIMNNQGNRQRNTLSSNQNSGFNNFNSNSYPNNPNNRQNSNNNIASNSRTSNSITNSSNRSSNEGLLTVFPNEIIKDLDIKVDLELNSFIVSGDEQKIGKFAKFVNYIDKPIPVITIEVMILEVNKSATVETGISWGIGEDVSKTKGATFPTTDMTIGSNEINKIISKNNGFGSFNLGKVLPEFYMDIKAMEANGDIKVRSTPKLSTLNGHRSSLSIGETTYYVVTNQNYYGSQIPQASEIKNYQPIDAQLAIDLKPLVSGDGQITMEINVIQSSFNNNKISEDAPPGINSREFTSIVRVRDQELIVLGGLEEKVKNDSGSGVPFLARIPVIKWFFSNRKREDSKKKLVILIKPTVIY
ncbi:type II and III secretion system protein [Lutibacter sp.]|uniref:type II secretion system protein GspD n=1 Tax=Lutibacter sp. TaxID=1925666 RepID=UPI0025C1A77D|nr:type II and III secretion system protein [Lutibacter sp.]MCF6168801.1 type II and III secretion system protein [Lutibacter sp.]